MTIAQYREGPATTVAGIAAGFTRVATPLGTNLEVTANYSRHIEQWNRKENSKWILNSMVN